MTGSLRNRLLLGATLWTLGLLPLGHYGSIALMIEFPALRAGGHALLLLSLAVFFSVAGLAVVRRGVAPINQLRDRLAEVRSGRAARLEGTYASEVQPLVDDLNALLAERDDAVRRAQAKAGDLAHGLKTPLAILTQEADRARGSGQGDLAIAIDQQVDRMTRRVDYHLAHARAAAASVSPRTACPVHESAEGLARTMRRLHAARELNIEVDVPPGENVRVQREDLDEILGNLLDNACKWARTRVRLEARRSGSRLTLAIDDDGPGIASDLRDRVMQRGVRADQAAPGSGFGLAIVRDLVDVYSGSLQLDESALGGLRAVVVLPSTHQETP